MAEIIGPWNSKTMIGENTWHMIPLYNMGMEADLLALVGRRMRMMRELAGATKHEMAEALGIHVSRLTRIEDGKIEPSFAEFSKFCALLDVPPAFLMGRTDLVPVPLPWTSENSL